MSNVELSNNLFAELAGWEAVKQARVLVAADRVLSSDWQPPLLRGMVRAETSTYRAGLVIKSRSDAENICSCRESRQRGIICAHSVAVGLHYLKVQAQPTALVENQASKAAQGEITSKPKAKVLQRASAGQSGEPLELFLILPPNFSDALSRGKVMLYLEGKWRNGRGPLNALGLTTPFVLSEQDGALLDALEHLNDGDTPVMLQLNAGQLAELLSKLVNHPRVTLGKSHSVDIIGDPLRLAVRATLESNGEIVVRLADQTRAGVSTVCGDRTAWIFTGTIFQPLRLPACLQAILAGTVRISRTRVPMFLNLEWPRILSECDVEATFSLGDFTLEAAIPRFTLHLAGGLAMLQAKLDCFYGEKPVSSMQDDSAWLPDPQSPTVYRTRNLDAEQAAVARLLRSGFIGPDQQGLYHLKGQNLVLNFFAREYRCLEREWKVTLEERLERSTQQNLERIEPRFQITPSGEQWFDLNVSYETRGGDRFAAGDIQRLLLSGQGHTRLRNGKFALLDTGAVEELQEVLLDCAPEQHSGSYRLSNVQAGFLDATLRQQPSWQVQAPTTWSHSGAQQRGEIKLKPPHLGELEPVLRPYQKEGVGWLHFLRANRFGGILADEMGLGKTLQVLALFNSMRTAEYSAHNCATAPPRTPQLVVCPTSVVFNWVAEAAKFAPQMRVLALHGPGRHDLFAQISQFDLVVTSYALLRRDAEHYRGLEFDTVVLDEAQHIKNRQTQNAQAVKAIRSKYRLVLTGTPLENSVLDLWSIFDFLMPGYLGAAQDFRERYELPIARDKNATAQSRLARRLRPFMLRRLKRDVAADLPQKIEQVSYCELNDEQRALYQQVLDASRREIIQAVDGNGLARSRMVVLTALLRLRQICCDLRLLKLEGVPPATSGSPADGPQESVPAALQPRNLDDSPASGEPISLPQPSGPNIPSGKVELFAELLEEVLDGGHRVLVFSQFTSMLALLREELSAQNIEFCYLDGGTKNRGEVVDKFQHDAGIPVFLISLKAGGVGLNLTGADTIIHFDPWWNPAVESQATDRAHRIGQKKVVTSYKLITRGTVEEKILNLQVRKHALFQGMLGAEEQLVAALDWQEIRDLLAE